MLQRAKRILVILALCVSTASVDGATETDPGPREEAQSEIEKGPVISQFRENWILSELRTLR